MMQGESGLPKRDYIRYAAVVALAVLSAVIGFLLLRYGMRAVLPFLLAWFLSLLIHPLAAAISARFRLPCRLVCVLLLFLVVILAVWLLSLTVSRIFLEMKALFSAIEEDGEQISVLVDRFLEQWDALREKLPRLFDREEDLLLGRFTEEALVEILRSFVGDMGGRLSAMVATILREVPSILLFLITFLMASVYFCLDGERMLKGVASFFHGRLHEGILNCGKRVSSILFRYFRVYACMYFLTFAMLCIGFSLLRVRYAFLLALLISAVDILPILGVGAILLPWAGGAYLLGNPKMALELMILWGVITLVRQIVEPRLIGESFGLHPIVSLFALYGGVKLFGVLGVFVAPAAAVGIRILLDEQKHPRTKEGKEDTV